jgi:hypothetical protein
MHRSPIAEDYVWECGFTQSYDPEVAAEWEEAFRS